MKCVWVGTSGWIYKEWAGHFYPKGGPKKDELQYYAGHFPTVEINATFYRLPTLKMAQAWHDRSPEGFRFAVKGSRFLTHIKRLRDTGAGLKKYFSRLAPLARRMGPVLWQLPPNFMKSADTMKRLASFLARVPRQFRHAVEFRHPSWLDEETFALLRAHQAANVWLSSLRMPADYTLTSDFVYLRFHGLKDGARHDYTDDELRPWAKQLAAVARKGLPAFVYFNNDLNTRAPLNAKALMALLSAHAVEPAGAAKAVIPMAAPRKKRANAAASRGARKGGSDPRRPEQRRTAARKIKAPRPVGVRRFAAAAFAPSALPPTH
jgi:uncharacterized protein YecE (DUF72 family)